jgi:hypothetical protein
VFTISDNYKATDYGCDYLAIAFGSAPFDQVNSVKYDSPGSGTAIVLFGKRFDSLFKGSLDSAFRSVGFDKDRLFLVYS